jgi:predicted nucleic acid-binding protein
MSVFFFDSSVLTKRYVIESGTTWVLNTVADNSGHHILIAQISPVEVFSAISRYKRENRISARTSRAIRVYLERHIFREYDVITLSDSIIQAAQDLLDKYTLRAYDAVQLASALDSNSKLLKANLAPLIFVCADTRLNAVAVNEGLQTYVPV